MEAKLGKVYIFVKSNEKQSYMNCKYICVESFWLTNTYCVRNVCEKQNNWISFYGMILDDNCTFALIYVEKSNIFHRKLDGEKKE